LKTLDVGCGNTPRGDVNIDLFFYIRCKNFVIGEAHHLPFKTGVFESVYSKHCLEHLESPLQFFKEAKRILKNGGTLECIYPTDTKLTKKTIHNLLNLRWSSAFKWRAKLIGAEKINYGGHKWQLPDDKIRRLLQKAGFGEIEFTKIRFPIIRTDSDQKKNKWKIFINKHLPTWQIETKFIAKSSPLLQTSEG
jgi:ubiquinone/menaquinone biosynthesis C-methylase UbiE